MWSVSECVILSAADGLTFTVDDTVLGTASPPDGGFWEMGGFGDDTWRNNPWDRRTKMAPFDQPVRGNLSIPFQWKEEPFDTSCG